MVKTISIKAGVKTKTSTHVYRHSLATHLIQSGFTIAQVRDKLRHSSISITNGYVRSNPGEQMTMTQSIDTII